MSQQAGKDDASLATVMAALARAAKRASITLAEAETEVKNNALLMAASILQRRADDIIATNGKDMAMAKEKNLSGVMLDRLHLDAKRIDAMIKGIHEVIALPDPVGDTIARWERPNGLTIARVRVPLGVIGVIFESRPNVAADAASLCLKSGNAVILRPGSESFCSAQMITDCMREGCGKAGLPEDAVRMVPTRDRAAVGLLLRMDRDVDVIVPRGGEGLIRRVVEESRIPVFRHLQGLCHTYIHHSADPQMARRVTYNAKMRRPGICGATETILIDRSCLASHLPALIDALLEGGCRIRGDRDVAKLNEKIEAVDDRDWDIEYLDAVVSIRAVDGLDQAIAHVRRHGSGHTEAIIAGDDAAADRFLAAIDSAIVMHNTSTQFADGNEFGMGAEIGIATGKLHARGPVGAEQLTSYKYVVRGQGQTRA